MCVCITVLVRHCVCMREVNMRPSIMQRDILYILANTKDAHRHTHSLEEAVTAASPWRYVADE